LEAGRPRNPASTPASKASPSSLRVSRDVELLEQFGLLRTRYETNPGHGRRRIVEPRAEKFHLIATV
jgi:hypothetical protein